MSATAPAGTATETDTTQIERNALDSSSTEYRVNLTTYTDLGVGAATGVFAAGYLIGLLALFAPGGLGVREAVLVALLTPAVGSGGAIVLSVASRVLLTVTEGVAALVALMLGRRTARSRPEAGRSGAPPAG